MRKLRIALIAAVVLVLGLGAVAYATIPDGSGVIHGCRKNSDGSVRVIDSDLGQTCPNGWTPLDWSQTGPQGPAGPPGLAGVHVVTVVVSSTTQVLCSAGETALGIAFSQTGQVFSKTYSSSPIFDTNGVTPIGFLVDASAATSNAHLTCATTA